MAYIYFRLIQMGKKKMSDVPKDLKKEVKKLIDAAKQENNNQDSL